jgi:hypothetical protein
MNDDESMGVLGVLNPVLDRRDEYKAGVPIRRALDSVSGRCAHFNGLHHERCKAGVAVLSVRDTSVRRYRWPCITFVGQSACATTCASFRAETQEERDAANAEGDAAVQQFYRELAHHRCPICNTTIRELQQKGSCVYVAPCGHRIGQGDAAVMAQSLGLAEGSAHGATPSPATDALKGI